MSQITISELSKTELKKILTEKEVVFNAGANHQELIDLVTKTLGTDTIDDGLDNMDPKNPTNLEGDELKKAELQEQCNFKWIKFTNENTIEELEELLKDSEPKVQDDETPAQRKVREKAEKKAVQVKRVPWEYIVKSNLKIDGKFYKAGETIELDESQAEGLLADWTIE